MFRNAHQSGFLSILYSVGTSPLSIWDQKVKNGHIRRVTDEDVQSLALEISGTNVATTYIICPNNPKQTLGIRLPFFVMIVKNMKKYFTFEIQILDDKNQPRRFRVSNYQSTTRVRPFCTTMPIGLSSGWNQIQFNLADFTRRAYGSTYLETLRVQIHANVRVRRIYFCDRLYSEDEMPKEYKLYLPLSEKRGGKLGKKDTVETKEQGTEVKKDGKGEEIPSGAPPTPTESTRQEPAPEVQKREEAPAPEAAPPEEVGEAVAADTGEEGPTEVTEAVEEVGEVTEVVEELADEATVDEPMTEATEPASEAATDAEGEAEEVRGAEGDVEPPPE